jgi:hypothetical protein
MLYWNTSHLFFRDAAVLTSGQCSHPFLSQAPLIIWLFDWGFTVPSVVPIRTLAQILRLSGGQFLSFTWVSSHLELSRESPHVHSPATGELPYPSTWGILSLPKEEEHLCPSRQSEILQLSWSSASCHCSSLSVSYRCKWSPTLIHPVLCCICCHIGCSQACGRPPQGWPMTLWLCNHRAHGTEASFYSTALIKSTKLNNYI